MLLQKGSAMSGHTLGKTRQPSDEAPPRKGRRKQSIIAFEMIRLDRSAAKPLHEQLTNR